MKELAVGHISRRLVLLGALICSMLVGLEAWHEWDQRAADIQQTETSALNVAHAVAREADATFRLADTVLFGITERLQNGGRSPEALSRLSRSMATATRSLDTVGALFVYDAQGNWIASSLAQIPTDVNNADRAYFQFHQADSSLAPHLSEPIRSRSSGSWIILVSRRLQNPDGSFAGVVAATVDVERFVQRLSGFDVGSGVRYRNWLMGTGLALAMAGSAVAQGHDHMHMDPAAPKSTDTPATREFKASHERMMQGMMVPYTGDPDVDFRLQMIPHHQGAIEMAQVAMKRAKDPWSRQLAESIIVEQQREIAQMRAWLEQHGVATPASDQPTHIMGAASYRSLSNEAGTRTEAVGQSWAPGGGVR